MTESLIVVIVPAYNEARTVGRVVTEVLEVLPDARVVVVNDWSSDETAGIARDAGALVLDLPFNVGIGGAVQAGYRYAREIGAAVVVQVDGDGQHDAASLPTLLEPIRRGEAEIVVGSRFIHQTAGGSPEATRSRGFQSSPARRVGIRVLAWLVGALLGRRVTDPTSGFRACGRRAISAFAEDYPSDYPEPESLVTAGRMGLAIVEIPVLMRPRTGGVSSISPLRALYYMSKVIYALVFRRQEDTPNES